jgi:hypothetical protein
MGLACPDVMALASLQFRVLACPDVMALASLQFRVLVSL